MVETSAWVGVYALGFRVKGLGFRVRRVIGFRV